MFQLLCMSDVLKSNYDWRMYGRNTTVPVWQIMEMSHKRSVRTGQRMLRRAFFGSVKEESCQEVLLKHECREECCREVSKKSVGKECFIIDKCWRKVLLGVLLRRVFQKQLAKLFLNC